MAPAMTRRHDIDALRGIAFALLILYHTAMAYVAEWDFPLKSAHTFEWLQWPMIALNRWRMPLLFVISGIAIGLARPERGPWRLATKRSWRLLLPLLFGMFVVVAVQAYCEGVGNGHLRPGFGAFLWRYWQVRPWPPGSFSGWEHGITWNHLWYLGYLWPYTMLLLAGIAASRLLPPRCSASRPRLPAGLASALLLLLPILWESACLLVLMPRYPQTHAMLGDWFVHAQSLPLFVFGYAVARDEHFWHRVRHWRWPTLLLALLAMTTELGIRWAGRNLAPGTLSPALAALPWYTIERVARACYTWFALLALLGWSKTLLDRPFCWLPYCNEAVFPWYVLHQSLIIAMVYWLAPLDLGPWQEPLLVLACTVAGCATLHEVLIRRVAWLRPLFGLPRLPAGSGDGQRRPAPEIPPPQEQGVAPPLRRARADDRPPWTS